MAGLDDEIELNEETILLQGADFEILGTSCSEQEQRVFVWCATEGVKLYDVEGRRCLLSLPPPKTKLAMVGVDRSHDLGCVFAVTEGNEVCCWDISLDKKENKKSKLRKTAPLEKGTARTVSLLSSPSSPLLFLVSRSGEISAYDPTTSKTRRIDSPSQQKIEVLDAKLITTNTTQEGEVTVQIFLVFQTSKTQIGVGVVSILLTNQGKDSRVLSRAHSSLIRAPVSSSSGSPSPSASTPNLKNTKEKPSKGGKSTASFSSFTVNHEEGKASICWSNGYLQLFSYSLDNDTFSLTEQFTLHISCFKDQPTAAPTSTQSTKRKRKAASVAAVSLPSASPLFSLQLNPSFLAVFGQNKSRYTLTIWETVHGTLSSSRTISPPPSSSSPLSVSLHNKSDFLVVGFSHTVLILPVSVPKKSLLAGVIGKASATLPYLAEDSQGRFIEAPLSSNVKIGFDICRSLDGDGLKKYAQVINDREQEEQQVIEKLTSRSATPTAEKFMDTFTEYASKILVPGTGKKPESIEPRNKRPITPSTNSHMHYKHQMKTRVINLSKQRRAHDDPSFSYNFLHSVMGRCLEECSEGNEDFWEPIQTFIKSHYVYSRQIPKLVPLVLKQERLDVLCDCLLYIHDISEIQLVSIIQFLLHNDDEEDNTFVDPETNEKATVEQRREILLNLCIRKPTNGEFLRPALTLLNEAEVALLLEYLKDQINGHTTLPEMSPDQETLFGVKVKSVKMNGVLELVMALLDSQLSTILFSEVCSSVLLDLSLATKEQVGEVKELQTISGELWNVMNRREGKSQMQGVYSYEPLKL